MEKKVWNLIILDASGSMSSIQQAAVMGVQETISGIRASQQEVPDMKQMLTLISFADDYRVHYDHLPITEVKDFTPQDYVLRGCTALFDAMGRSLNALEQHVGAEDRVLVTVITDGYENASREFSGAMIHELVERLKKKDWVFTFIGTNDIDVSHVSRSLGIDNAMAFCRSEAETREMFIKERRYRRSWIDKISKGFRADCNYFEEDDINKG